MADAIGRRVVHHPVRDDGRRGPRIPQRGLPERRTARAGAGGREGFERAAVGRHVDDAIGDRERAFHVDVRGPERGAGPSAPQAVGRIRVQAVVPRPDVHNPIDHGRRIGEVGSHGRRPQRLEPWHARGAQFRFVGVVAGAGRVIAEHRPVVRARDRGLGVGARRGRRLVERQMPQAFRRRGVGAFGGRMRKRFAARHARRHSARGRRVRSDDVRSWCGRRRDGSCGLDRGRH